MSGLMLDDQKLFRDKGFVGDWCDAESGETTDLKNPATGEVLVTLPKMGALETRTAIEQADAALSGWQARGVDGRRFPWGELEDASLARCLNSRKEAPQPEPVNHSYPAGAIR